MSFPVWKKIKSSLWPFQQLSAISYNFILWQGEELPCEGDTPFSKRLLRFLFTIGQNQVPWTPSIVSSKRKNLSLNLCSKRNFYQQERKPKEGMLVRNPVSLTPQWMALWWDRSELEVPRRSGSKWTRMENQKPQLREREGGAGPCSLLRTQHPISSASFPLGL